jgi:hypothetical protein
VQAPADAGTTRLISWLRQIAHADRFQHLKTAISTESYGNSGLGDMRGTMAGFTAYHGVDAAMHQWRVDELTPTGSDR